MIQDTGPNLQIIDFCRRKLKVKVFLYKLDVMNHLVLYSLLDFNTDQLELIVRLKDTVSVQPTMGDLHFLVSSLLVNFYTLFIKY